MIFISIVAILYGFSLQYKLHCYYADYLTLFDFWSAFGVVSGLCQEPTPIEISGDSNPNPEA